MLKKHGPIEATKILEHPQWAFGTFSMLKKHGPIEASLRVAYGDEDEPSSMLKKHGPIEAGTDYYGEAMDCHVFHAEKA